MSTAKTSPSRVRPFLLMLPLLLFAALAMVFLVQLTSGRDNRVVPSALLGRSMPDTRLPPLEGTGLPGFDSAELRGSLTLVNVWASWCGPCRDEHPLLMALAQDGRVRIAGLNYKDNAANARRFLGELGNPYEAVGTDGTGRAAIDWGVYGVPETFLVGHDGTILYKHVGPLTPDVVERDLMPMIEATRVSAS